MLAATRALKEQGFAPATTNNHLASLSGFTTWVHAQSPRLFPVGDPAKGIGELGLPPLEPRALTAGQVRSLKNLCDRLERFHQLRGQRWAGDNGTVPIRATGRPLRDRAMIYVLLSTGLRREELIRLDLEQVNPHTPAALRQARQGRIARVQGKGNTERTVFLSNDARLALADYLERERPRDVAPQTTALFVSATGIPERAADGRLSPRAVNLILTQIGCWHDAELKDLTRHVSPLKPHDLRHTFAFQLTFNTRPRARTPTSWNGDSATARSATSNATPIRPRRSPLPISRSSNRYPGRMRRPHTSDNGRGQATSGSVPLPLSAEDRCGASEGAGV